jgi:hypothetical protein
MFPAQVPTLPMLPWRPLLAPPTAPPDSFSEAWRPPYGGVGCLVEVERGLVPELAHNLLPRLVQRAHGVNQGEGEEGLEAQDGVVVRLQAGWHGAVGV